MSPGHRATVAAALGESETNRPSVRIRLTAEALGTFPFFFLGFNALAVATDLGGRAISTLGIALGFGLGLTMAISALGQISGGHFNPAVSLGLAAARRLLPRNHVTRKRTSHSSEHHESRRPQ